jgi:hypothetical protein
VLYEISTGKDRNDYPELPAEMGSAAEARELIQFNKIVLKACRTNPRLRYQSAEELMSDLLAFHFGQRSPLSDQIGPGWVKLGLCVIIAAVVLILLLAWRVFVASSRW